MSEYPKNWRWDEDGDELVGRYRSWSAAHTQSGDVVPIVVLEVKGELRSVWLFHEALREKFRAEIKSRPDQDLDPGEEVQIRRGEEGQIALEELPIVRLGRRVLIDEGDLAQFVAARRYGGRAA